MAVAVQGFDASNFLKHETRRIQDIVDDKKALAACSGGVDSTVATLVAREAIRERLHPVFIDTGFVRQDEAQQIKARLASSPIGLDVKIIHASGRFFDSAKDKTDAEDKRALFRETFYQVLKEEAARLGCEFVVQGTIAPDWIETQGGIKTQHNVLEQIGINPSIRYGYKIIEPLSELYKDQVRNLAKHLQLPLDMSERQPFPGPGLLVRCIGQVTKNKMQVLKHATKIVENNLGPSKYDQYFAAVVTNNFVKDSMFRDVPTLAGKSLGIPIAEVSVDIFEDRVTGVKGDVRSYGRFAGIKLSENNRETFGWLHDKLSNLQSTIIQNVNEITRVGLLVKEKRNNPSMSIIIRAVSTHDFMTAAVAPVPWKILKDTADDILKLGACNRVYYDITPKPPGTIEFE